MSSRRRTRGAVLAATLAIAAAGVLWWNAAATLAPAPPRMPGTAAPAVRAAADASSPATTAAATLADRAIAGAPSPPPRSHGVVQVVDERGVPVAGAAVQWTTREWECRWLGFAPADVEHELAAAPVATSDAQGFAPIATDAADVFVRARAGDRFGQAELQLGDPLRGAPQLEVRADADVHVIVRGAAGQPCADVPVLARFQADESDALDDRTEIVVGRSDADGRLVVRHAQCLGDWFRDRPRVELRALVFGEATEWREWTAAAGARVLELPCPDHGGVLGRTPHRPDPTLLTLRPIGGDDADAAPHLVQVATVRADAVLLHPVALRRAWSLHARGCRPHQFDGPVSPGQTVAVLCVQDHELAQLDLVDANGAPLADRRVTLRWPVTGRTIALRLQTDGDGSVRWNHDASQHRTVRVEARGDRLAAAVTIPAAPPGRAFRARLVLLPQPVVASGRVVDATSGLPVDAGVTLRTAHGDAAHTARTAADGTFVVHGDEPGAFTMTVSATHYARCKLTGTSELPVEVALVRVPRLAVTLLVDPELPLAAFDLHVEGSTGGGWSERAGRRDAVVDLPARVEGLVLEVRPAAGMPAVARIASDSWEPAPGGYRAVVDLRGRLAAATIEARCEGREVPAEMFVPFAPDMDWSCLATAGFRWAMARDAAHDVVVVAREHGCAAATLRAGANVVELPAPALLRAAVTGAPADFDGELRVGVFRLARREPLLDRIAGGERPPPHPWPLDASQLAELDDGEPHHGEPVDGALPLVRRGSYAVVPCVRRGSAELLLPAWAKVVEIDVLGERVGVQLAVPPAAVHAAWERLGR